MIKKPVLKEYLNYICDKSDKEKRCNIWIFAFRLECPFHAESRFWHMIYFQFRSFFPMVLVSLSSTVAWLRKVIARNVSLVLRTDKCMYCTTVSTKVCREREKRRKGWRITGKWRTASLRWNHSWKPTSGFAWRTVEIATDFLSLWKEIVIS